MNKLQIEKLSKKLGRKDILKNISLNLNNAVYGLLGANGAGKTTLMRCLTGIYGIKNNAVLHEGKPIEGNDAYWKQIGYLPQAFGAFRELTLYEMMRYFCALKGIRKDRQKTVIADCLEAVNLQEEAQKRIGSLSGGMVRRAGIAQTLIGNPNILYYDEPTAGLDPNERTRFQKMIFEQEADKLIIISTHIVEDVSNMCRQVIVMDKGEILFCGACDELCSLARNRVYSVPSSEAQGLSFIKTIEKDGIRYDKVFSDTPLPYPAEETTLEDTYLCLINGYIKPDA